MMCHPLGKPVFEEVSNLAYDRIVRAIAHLVFDFAQYFAPIFPKSGTTRRPAVL